MKIAVDMDGTLTSAPSLFGQLIRDLREKGNYVALLTGQLDSGLPSLEDRQQQLRGLGIEVDAILLAKGSSDPMSHLWTCGQEKARMVREGGFDVFIDDRASFCNLVKLRNPDVLVLQIVAEDPFAGPGR